MRLRNINHKGMQIANRQDLAHPTKRKLENELLKADI